MTRRRVGPYVKKQLRGRGWTTGCMRAHESGSEEKAVRVTPCCESVKDRNLRKVFSRERKLCFGWEGRILQSLTLLVCPTAMGCWQWLLAAEAAG